MSSLKKGYYRNLLLSVNRGMAGAIHSNAKPLYILSLIKCIENGDIIGNKIMYTDQLENIYNRLSAVYEPTIKTTLFYKPFFHLSKDTFYNLVWKKDREPPKGCHTPSAKYIRENIAYAYLDPELWDLLQDAEVRSEFREAIINHYLVNSKK